MKSWLRIFLCLSSNLFLVQSKQLKQLIHSDPKDSLERRNRIPKIKNPEKFSNIMPTLKNELDRSEKWKNVRFLSQNNKTERGNDHSHFISVRPSMTNFLIIHDLKCVLNLFF